MTSDSTVFPARWILIGQFKSQELLPYARLDGADGCFLKSAASAISNSLTTVFNLSISSGVFSHAWKVAKVTPLFKEGSLLDRSNFRPISVFAIVS